MHLTNSCWLRYIYALPRNLPAQFMHLPGTCYNMHYTGARPIVYYNTLLSDLVQLPAQLCIIITFTRPVNRLGTFNGYLLQYAFTGCMRVRVHANAVLPVYRVGVTP